MTRRTAARGMNVAWVQSWVTECHIHVMWHARWGW